MHPSIWGKHAWNFLHLVTMAYPENPTEADKQHYYEFLNQLRWILPCSKCRRNYVEHLRTYPLTEHVLSSRTNLVKWGIDMHNIVNYYTGKPIVSYPDAMEQLTLLSSPPAVKKSNSNSDWLYLGLVVVAFALLCFMIWYIFFRKSKD